MPANFVGILFKKVWPFSFGIAGAAYEGKIQGFKNGIVYTLSAFGISLQGREGPPLHGNGNIIDVIIPINTINHNIGSKTF